MMPKSIKLTAMAVVIISTVATVIYIACHIWDKAAMSANMALSWVLVYETLKSSYMWKDESKRVVDMHNAIMDDILSNYELKRKPNKIDVKICMN